MNKSQLMWGMIVSIVALAVLCVLIEISNTVYGQANPATYSVVGWDAGMFGLFFAAADE